jgi:hypothetical protein
MSQVQIAAEQDHMQTGFSRQIGSQQDDDIQRLGKHKAASGTAL